MSQPPCRWPLLFLIVSSVVLPHCATTDGIDPGPRAETPPAAVQPYGISSGLPVTPDSTPPPPVTVRRRFRRPFLFAASDGIHGYELFSYDGAAPPVMAADLRAAARTGDPGSSPSGMTELKDRVYFSADDGIRGRELFYYDPVSKKSGLAAEIDRVDQEGSDPQGLFVHGGVLYFSADDKVLGRELWSFDPSDGAARHHDLAPGGNSDPVGFAECGGRLYLLARSPMEEKRAVWALDDAGKTGSPVPALGALTVGGTSLGVLGGRIFLSADDGKGSGTQLWYYDCREGVAGSLGRINREGGSNPGDFSACGQDLWFTAADGVHGAEVWSMDGRTGAFRMAELNVNGDSYPFALTCLGDRLFFNGFDQNYHLLCSADLASKPPVSCFTSFHDPAGLRVHEGELFFSAFVPCRVDCSESLGRELWRYDGINPPSMVEDLWPGPGSGM